MRIRELSQIISDNACELEEPYESDTGAGKPSCVWEKEQGNRVGVPYIEELCKACQLAYPALNERRKLRKVKSRLVSQIVADAWRRIQKQQATQQ